MTTDSVWEYEERFYEFKGHPLVQGSSITKEIWDAWEPKVFELIGPDLDSGWQIDQSYWGPHRIQYKVKKANLLSQGNCGAWVLFIVFVILTAGIGLLLAPFLRGNFMEFKGIEVRFMKRRT